MEKGKLLLENKNVQMNKITNLMKATLRGLEKLNVDEIDESDIEGIENILFEYQLINGERTNITVEDISYFPALKNITLKGYKLSMKDIETLSRNKKLNSVSFDECDLREIDFEKIEDFPETIVILGYTKIPKKLPKVRNIKVINSIINFNSIDLESINSIEIIDSTINCIRNISDYEQITNTNFDGSNFYDSEGTIVEDIEVPKKSTYSHKGKVIYKVDGITREN